MIATLLRKPIKKTVAQNALENGCGGLNIDATRVGYSDVESINFDAKQRQQADPQEKGWSGHVAKVGTEIQMFKEKGRWPANFILKGSCPTEKLDSQCKDASRYFKQVTTFKELLEYLAILITPPKEIKSNVFIGYADDFLVELEDCELNLHGAVIVGEFTKEQAQSLFDCMLTGSHLVLLPYDSYNVQTIVHLEDCGLDVRDSILIAEEDDFMYAKKASKREREKGLEDLNNEKRKNTHPTVKPIEIMEWCLRDIPKGDNVVDPFMGSGTTGIAARRQGYPFVGMEISPEYLKIARARIESAKDES